MTRINRDRLRQRYALRPNMPVIFKGAVSMVDPSECRRGNTRMAYDNSVVITATVLTLGIVSLLGETEQGNGSHDAVYVVKKERSEKCTETCW